MRLWVVGHDIGLTPVPAMFQATMEHLGIEGHCQVRDVAPRILPALVEELRGGVVHGCVVARPYGAPMAKACDHLSPDAEMLGAVNVVVGEGGVLSGDHTLPLGFEMGLSVHRMWPRQGGRAVILGTGAAAAAVALALSRVPAGDLAISGRREEATLALADRLARLGSVRPIHWGGDELDRALGEADLLVNCTPAGLDELPISLHKLPARGTVADMRLDPYPSDLAEAARAAHRRGVDGADIFLQTQMLAFARCAGMTTSLRFARAVLYGVLESPHQGPITP